MHPTGVEPNRDVTLDITSSDSLPQSCRRLVGAKAIRLGSCVPNILKQIKKTQILYCFNCCFLFFLGFFFLRTMNPLFALALVLAVTTTVYHAVVEGCNRRRGSSGGGPCEYVLVMQF